MARTPMKNREELRESIIQKIKLQRTKKRIKTINEAIDKENKELKERETAKLAQGQGQEDEPEEDQEPEYTPVAKEMMVGPKIMTIHKPMKGKGNHPVKSSHDEVEERRKQVARLRMRGLGFRAIGKLLGFSSMTIKRDLECIREDNKKRVNHFEYEQHLGESLSVFEECELRAWQDYHEAHPGTIQRKHFLDTIQNARNNQIKLLTDVGLISKEPTKVDVTVKNDAIQHWTPEAQALIAMAILKSKLPPVAEPVKDKYIEAHTATEDGEQ